MSQKNLDCKGLPCPQPVLLCKQCIDAQRPRELIILVDNEAARQNVTRFLGTQGYDVRDEQLSATEWRIVASNPQEVEASTSPEQTPPGSQSPQHAKTLIFLSSPGIGQGDPVLGEKLLASFLATLPEMGDQLWRVILVNGAVHLTVKGHPCLESLQKLEAAGVSILVCGTCLTHFGLLEQKAVGQTTNMLDVVTSLQLADKVIGP